MSLLKVKDLNVDIIDGEAAYRVINQLSFELEEASVLAVVGESGCGKSMLAYSLQGLLPAAAKLKSGHCYFEGQEVDLENQEKLRKLRRRDYAMIFQNPMTALNPLIKVGLQVAEALPRGTEDAKAKVCAMFEEVKLRNPERIYSSYPHQLSGGMRQRVMIAMALISSPKFLIADEPTTALDVTTEAEIIALLKELMARYKTSLLFISHDLALVRQIADRVAIMYAGEIVEIGDNDEVFNRPKHPYTQGLLASRPSPADKGKLLKTIAGRVPALERRDYSKCVYYRRCQQKLEICASQKPLCHLDGDSFNKCHLGLGKVGVSNE